MYINVLSRYFREELKQRIWGTRPQRVLLPPFSLILLRFCFRVLKISKNYWRKAMLALRAMCVVLTCQLSRVKRWAQTTWAVPGASQQWQLKRNERWHETFLPDQAPGQSQLFSELFEETMQCYVKSVTWYSFHSSSKTTCSLLSPCSLWWLRQKCPLLSTLPAKLNPFRCYHKIFPHCPSQNTPLPFSRILKQIFIITQADNDWVTVLCCA